MADRRGLVPAIPIVGIQRLGRTCCLFSIAEQVPEMSAAETPVMEPSVYMTQTTVGTARIVSAVHLPWHFLNFIPDPQVHLLLRPTFACDSGRSGWPLSCSRRFLMRSSVRRTGGFLTPSGMMTLSSSLKPNRSGSCSGTSHAGRTWSFVQMMEEDSTRLRRNRKTPRCGSTPCF